LQKTCDIIQKVEAGFMTITALPGGYVTSNGTFGGIGMKGYWWSATECQTSNKNSIGDMLNIVEFY
jgi:hypothetical protein